MSRSCIGPTTRPIYETKQSPSELTLGLLRELTRHRPTLPHSCPCSTIGSEELDFRVRDGIGYGLFDIGTGNFWASKAALWCCASYGYLGMSLVARYRPESGHQLQC